MPRSAAAAVAAICWAALVIQFNATLSQTGSAYAALWIILRFFTVTTNLLVAAAMTKAAFNDRVPPVLLGGATVAILLVGVVYMTLLRGLVELSGGALLADTLLHKVSPIAMMAWWLLFAPHGRLKWSAPLWWSLYPLAYFTYAIARGASDGRYPYPFMDVGKIGAVQTALNAAAIAAAFVIAGFGLVWLDRGPLGRRRASL